MKNYDMTHIRNIALVGASGSGKTSLAEQMLFNAKAATRVGKVEDGNTIMDFQPEEIEKGMSMSLGVGYLEWKNHLINILDTPGYADFSNEQIAAGTAVENMIIVANAAAGFEVGLEQTLELLENKSMPKVLLVNRLDNEGADFFKIIETVKENSEIVPIPLFLPIGSETRFEGIVDIIKQKAFIKGKEVVPALLEVENLWLDIKIFIRTFISVFKSDGVVEGGTGTIEKSKNNTPKV